MVIFKIAHLVLLCGFVVGESALAQTPEHLRREVTEALRDTSDYARQMQEEAQQIAGERASIEVLCNSPEECELFWGRALTWVLQNSSFRVQMQSDILIQTYGSSGASPRSGFIISKEPLGNGVYRVNFSSSCANTFGCVPNPVILQADFNTMVMGLPPYGQQQPAVSKSPSIADN